MTSQDSESRPDLPFEIIWLGYNRRQVGVSTITRYDLTEAIRSAARMLEAGTSPKEAHGLFVRRKEA